MINRDNTDQWRQIFVTGDDSSVCCVEIQYRCGFLLMEEPVEYENSLKMVIIGMPQMTYGLFWKLPNHIEKDDYISVLFAFISQLIFMLSSLFINGAPNGTYDGGHLCKEQFKVIRLVVHQLIHSI